MSELKETPKAIDWPRVQIGAEEFTLRYSYASNYQLAKWGKTIQTATNVELAASMCGKFNSAGHWRHFLIRETVRAATLESGVCGSRRTHVKNRPSPNVVSL